MSSPGGDNRDDLIIVARAVRTRGLKGELVADLLTDFPERFESVTELTALGADGSRRQMKLESFWFQSDRIVLKFAGLETIESAQPLVGCEFGLPEAERMPLADNEFYDWELEGCVVENNSVAIGKVREVMRTGGVELLVVETDSGSEALIPVASDIVMKVDVENKRIVIDPPEGLLEL